MMRAFFITMTVLSLIFMIVAAAMMEVVDDYEWRSWDYYDYSYDSYSYDSYSYDSYDSEYYEEKADFASRLGGIFSLLYGALAGVAFLMALMKIKTQTMKVISIIGLSLAGILLLLSFLPIASPDNVGYDEIGPVFIIGAVALLGLDVVGIVHAFKTKT